MRRVQPLTDRLLSSDSRETLGCGTSTRTFVEELANVGQPVGTVAFNRTGTVALAAGNAGAVVLYDMKPPHAELWRPSPGGAQIESASFSPDDQRVAAVNAEGYLHVWSLAQREIDFSVKVYPDTAPESASGRDARPAHLRKLVWLPELRAIAVSTARGEVKLISTDVEEWLARARSLFPTASGPP
jgi:WD40 repeat protein